MTPEQKLQRRDRQLQAAQKISQVLFQHLEVADLVEQALKIALEVVSAQAGSVLLSNPETKELVFYSSIGDKKPAKGKGFPWDKGIAGSVFQLGEPIVISDVKGDSRHFGGIDDHTGYITHDMIALPLKKWDGDPIGVLEVLNKKTGNLDVDDVAILTIISAFTAIAIEQAYLHEEAKLAEVARVLGDIGHDVKNLLMPVICGATLLKDEIDEVFSILPRVEMGKAKASHALCHDVIQMLQTNANRIQVRVKEIADCVKGLSSPPVFKDCKILDVVLMVIDTLKLVAEEKGIILIHKELENLPIIQADESRMFNAFYNLINNAIAEVPKGGSIIVQGKANSNGDGIILEVKDTGRGMPAEVRDSLFTTHALSRKKGGTGLGTKIIKDVVDAHHGKISVESEVGIGTTFNILFPLGSPPASS